MMPQIEIWLNSKEFKEKYIDTKYSYPPLLNPNTIDYENIPADLAWEMNLPLPPFYDLILISGSNMGHNAILNFFEHCGAKRGADHLPKDLNVIYTSFYNFLIAPENKGFFKIIPFTQYDYMDLSKAEYARYCAFFTKKVPVLVQVRDPFIRLMIINDAYAKPNVKDVFSLNDDLSVFLDRSLGTIDSAFGGNFQQCIEYYGSECALRQASAIKGLNCIKQLDFIDTDSELMPNNAFQTMCNLAQRYNLKIPTNRTFFEGVIEDDSLFALLPITLRLTKEEIALYQKTKFNANFDLFNLHSNDTNIDIIITLYQSMNMPFNENDFIDISEIWGGAWLYRNSDIRLYTHKSNSSKLNTELKALLSHFFIDFKTEFIKRVEFENTKKFTLEDIFTYFKTHRHFARNFKANLDKELEIIKELRPDIVKSWTWYEKFEKAFENEGLKLFTIGPVELYECTKGVRQKPFVHFRTNEFSTLVKNALRKLGQMLGNDEENAMIYLASSGTGAMEGVVLNCVNDNDKALVINGGSFGKRFCELLAYHHKDFQSIDLKWNETLTKEHLKAFSKKGFTQLFVNLHETHTGQLYDAKMLSQFCQENNMEFIVDAIGTFLADPYDMKNLGVDVSIISSQKGLCLSPGMAFITFSKRMLDKISKMPNSECQYFNFKDYLKDIKRGQTPYTPPVLVMYELQDMIEFIEQNGGLKARLESVKERCEYFRQKARSLGFIIPNYPLSNALTPLYFENINAYEVIQVLKDQFRIFVNPCGGDLENKLLRVTHIGNTNLKDIDDLLEKLILSIKEVKNAR